MTQVPTISRNDAINRMKTGRFVTVSFIARTDNGLRVLNGQYSSQAKASGNECIVLRTMNGDRRKAGLWRNVPIEGIIAVRMDGVTYKVS